MIHLYNRVYIAATVAFKQKEDSSVIILSENPKVKQYAQEVQGSDPADIENVVFGHEVGHLLYCADNYTSLVQNEFEGDEQAFADFIVEWPADNTLIIYADYPTIQPFLIRWFKTIFPHATGDSVYTLMHLIEEFHKAQWIKSSYTSSGVDIPLPSIEDVQQKISFVGDKATLSSIVDGTEPFVFESFDETSVSVEFLLATYFHNKVNGTDWDAVSTLTQKIINFTKKWIVDSLLDTKKTFVPSLYHVNDILGSDIDIFNPDSVDTFVQSAPQYAWLFDDNFQPSNYEYVFENYNIAEVFDTSVEIIKKIDRETSGFFNDSKHEKMKMVHHNDISLDDVIAYEMESGYSRYVLSTEQSKEITNRYIMDYIFQLYKNNDDEKLRQLATQ